MTLTERMRIHPLIALIAVAIVSTTAQGQSISNPPSEIKPDGLLVAFHPGFERAIDPSAYLLEVDPSSQSPHFVRFRLTNAARLLKVDAEEVAESLAKHPSVRFAEPDHLRFPQEVIPNDTLFSQQWALRNHGSTYTPWEDIRATHAWKRTMGRPNVIVAVIDSGIRTTHDDLKNQILRDANNNIVGYNFANNNTDVSDATGHGTNIAGIIAAEANNGLGIAGVAPGCKLMPLRIVASTGAVTVSGIVSAIDFAIANGAKVINISFQGSLFSIAEYEALVRAGNANILVVASVANDYTEYNKNGGYPALNSQTLSNVISVNKSGPDRYVHDLSMHTYVTVPEADIAAPGMAIVTTARGSNTATTTVWGTSAATAHVSGVAALIYSVFPNMSAVNVKRRILRSADAFPTMSVYRTLGRRLNAERAVEVDTIPPSPPTSVKALQVSQTAITIAMKAGGDDGKSGAAAEYYVRYSYAPITATNFVNATPSTVKIAPEVRGTSIRFSVDGLMPDRDVYVAIRSVDNVGNVSDIVFLPKVRTLPGVWSDDVQTSAQWDNTAGITRGAGTYGTGQAWRGSGTITMKNAVAAPGPMIFYYEIGPHTLSTALSTATVSYSTDNGGTWTPVMIESRRTWGSLTTVIPSTAGQNVKVRIVGSNVQLDNFALVPAWVRFYYDGRKWHFREFGGIYQTDDDYDFRQPHSGTDYLVIEHRENDTTYAISKKLFNLKSVHRPIASFWLRASIGGVGGLEVRALSESPLTSDWPSKELRMDHVFGSTGVYRHFVSPLPAHFKHNLMFRIWTYTYSDLENEFYYGGLDTIRVLGERPEKVSS